MKFSNLLKAAIFSLFTTFALPAVSTAMDTKNTLSPVPADSAENVKIITRITQRVYEIQAMDKSNLSRSEKKALKKELKNLKAEAEATSSSNGIYLSFGAIIIIILLLILIL